jgi:hypothetical protein
VEIALILVMFPGVGLTLVVPPLAGMRHPHHPGGAEAKRWWCDRGVTAIAGTGLSAGPAGI